MRLVLLPGLNGSSRLFRPLLHELRGLPTQVLELPQQGPQDHESLSSTLLGQLDECPFLLLGESFSGSIAYRIAQRRPPGLQGVIFAASFLSCPSALLPLLQHLAILPRSLLAHALPLQLFCTGRQPEQVMLQQLQQEIRQMPMSLLRTRLKSLAGLKAPGQPLALPALHIWPRQDRLVSNRVAESITEHCRNIRQVRIDGPHFILQTRAEACADAIRAFVAERLKQNPLSSPDAIRE